MSPYPTDQGALRIKNYFLFQHKWRPAAVSYTQAYFLLARTIGKEQEVLGLGGVLEFLFARVRAIVSRGKGERDEMEL
jgi:hypothetical protein